MPFIILDDMKLHYRVPTSKDDTTIDPAKDTLLMLPGCGTTSLELFQPQFDDPRLNKKYNLAALDARSQGLTTAPYDTFHTLEDATQELLAAIDTLQWPGRVHLMGEGASGCIIALNAAILRPKFFKSLVLISPPSLVPSPDNKQLLTDLRDAFSSNKGTNGDGTGHLPDDAIEAFITYLQSDMSSPSQRSRVAKNFQRLFGEGKPIEAIKVIYRKAIPEEDLASISVPVLILRGTQDAASPLEGCEKLQKLLVNARNGCDLRLIHGAPNQLTLTHPGMANRFLAVFLDLKANA